jgi:hypothetical protein
MGLACVKKHNMWPFIFIASAHDDNTQYVYRRVYTLQEMRLYVTI